MKHARKLPLPYFFCILLLGLSTGCVRGSGTDVIPAPPAEPAPSLDGVTFSNRAEPYPGVLTGGQPTREEIEAAAKAGVKTVVNTRTKGESGEIPDEEALVEGLGMRYLFIPVGGAEDVTEENARKLLEVLEDPAALPAIVHCRSGRRVGLLLEAMEELRGAEGPK